MRKNVAKFVSMLALVVTVMLLFPSIFGEKSAKVQAANVKVWSGKTADRFASGSGTKNDPYIIKTGEQLNLVREDMTNVWYKLGADIYLNDTKDYKNWNKKAPKSQFKSLSTSFTNVDNFHFDGGGHTIYGLYTKEDGIFGYLYNSEIKNLKIKKCYITGRSAVCDYARYCTIENVTTSEGTINYTAKGVKSNITNSRFTEALIPDVVDAAGVGAVVGHAYNCILKSCTNSLTITTNYSAAGIVYIAECTNLADCHNKGNISIKETELGLGAGAAGIVVKYEAPSYLDQAGYSKGVINGCTNSGKISVESFTNAAGIAACTDGYADVINCMNSGSIYCVAGAGIISTGRNQGVVANCVNTGEIGMKGSKYSNFLAGLVATLGDTVMENCYTTGYLYDRSGGAICCDCNGTVRNCYYLKGSAEVVWWKRSSNSVSAKAMTKAELTAAGFTKTLNSGAKKSKAYMSWSQAKGEFPTVKLDFKTTKLNFSIPNCITDNSAGVVKIGTSFNERNVQYAKEQGYTITKIYTTDEKVCTVSKDGVVTCKGEGFATIYVIGKQKSGYNIAFSDFIYVTKEDLAETVWGISSGRVLEGRLYIYDTNYKDCTVVSSDESLAYVDEKLDLHLYGQGYVDVTITLTDGSSYTTKFYVTPNPDSPKYKIDNKNFPQIYKYLLNIDIDTNGDGYLSEGEIRNIRSIDTTLPISDISGLKKLHALSSIFLRHFTGTKIDITDQVFSNVSSVYVEPYSKSLTVNAPQIKDVFIDMQNNMDLLDLSKCEATTDIRLQTFAPTGLKSLKLPTKNQDKVKSLNITGIMASSFDFSKYSGVETIGLGYCGNIKSVDVSKCTKLKTLHIGPLEALKNVNASGCKNLERITVYYCPKLTNSAIKLAKGKNLSKILEKK